MQMQRRSTIATTAMIIITATMESGRSNSSSSGVTVGGKVGDVIEMVGNGVVNSLEGVIIGNTVTRKIDI